MAAWGPADITKNGVSRGTFEGHMMVTDDARNSETGKIVQSDGTTPYSPMMPDNSLVNRNTAQLHLVYHDAPSSEMTANFPPPFETFEHTMFYDIDVLPPTVKPVELVEPVDTESTMPSDTHTQTADNADGGGCLIATATYGSEMSPQVQLLREIRDNQLMNTESGSAFMGTFNDIYYSFSPAIADMERENPLFKEVIKIAITPMISSLSLMESANSESEVISLGLSVIALNLGMYLGVPAIVVVGIRKRI